MLNFIHFQNLSTSLGFLSGAVASVAVTWLIPSNNVTKNDTITCTSEANVNHLLCEFVNPITTSVELNDQVGGGLVLLSSFFVMILAALSSSMKSCFERADRLSERERLAVLQGFERKILGRVVLTTIAATVCAVAGGIFVTR
ncbi:hypothetical protein [Planktotalea sp.]|uniref:hypothetical protein n=1 Tax=Planktotalea sp. TaxID=2029877 RepID=UPI003D6C269A